MIPRIYIMTFIKEPCPNLYHKCLPNLAWKMLCAKISLPVWNHGNVETWVCCLLGEQPKAASSIELRKCGVCRQRKSSGARRKTECSWWPCMKNWFSSWNSMLPWGQGWAFLPWNKPAGLLKGKNAHPCPKGCILLSEENQCWMQGNQVLKIFFDCKRAVSV